MQAAALRLHLPRLAAAGAAALRDHAALAGLVFAYSLIGGVLALAAGVPERFSLTLYAGQLLPVVGTFLLAFFLAHPVYVMVRVRPRRLTRTILADWRDTYLTYERALTALPAILLLALFISVFTSIKTMIPVLQPFSWDAEFAALDRALHFGVDPWRLLQPVLGHPLVTSALNAVYHLWFFWLHAILLWQAFSLRDRRLRRQFLLTHVLIWSVLGSLAAIVFSSAGPCYFGAVTGLADPFAPLMAYLNEASAHYPVQALDVQERLWTTYLTGAYEMGGGISAMPSMHVASAMLFTLVGWRAHRLLGAAFAVITALILLGSVHLGWHYAIDGYAGLLGTWAIWRAVGWWLDARGRRGEAAA